MVYPLSGDGIILTQKFRIATFLCIATYLAWVKLTLDRASEGKITHMVKTRQFLRETAARRPLLARSTRPFAPVSILGLIFGGCVTLPVQMVSAQSAPEIEPPDTAGNRAQPAFDPSGITLGTIRAFPTLGLSSGVDSNVFARSSGVQSDIAFTLNPALRLDWTKPGRSVGLVGDVRVRRYAKLDRQNDEEYRADATAAVDITRRTAVSVAAGWSRSTAIRGSFENGFQVGGPLRQSRATMRLSARHIFNRLILTGGLSGERFRYDNVLLDDGTVIDQSFRDGSRFSQTLGANYEIAPRLSLTSQATFDTNRFKENRPAFNRDAKGQSFIAGVRYELTRLLIAEFGAGTRNHNFKNPAYGDISGLALNARLRWYPTPLTSVRFDLGQVTSTSAFDSVSAVVVTSGKLSVDHELRRNLILSAQADLANERYGQGSATSRLLTLSGQAAWKPNRMMRIAGRVSYDQRSSSSAAAIPQFNAFRVQLTLTLAR